MAYSQTFFILDGHKPVPVEDIVEWGKMFGNIEGRRVARTEKGDVTVSTVFLGMDHGFGQGPPLLFETMVFTGNSAADEYTRRCSTWEEAEKQHREIVATVFAKHSLILED